MTRHGQFARQTARTRAWIDPRPFALIAFTILLIAALAAPARASDDVRNFVETTISEGVAILQNEALGEADRKAQFRAFILGNTDPRTVALFTLGQFRRGAADAELDAFVKAFTDYAISVYEARLGEYAGETLAVQSITPRNDDDYVVATRVTGGAADSFAIGFRVQRRGGKLLVMDAEIEGIWLSVEQRAQFTSFLSQNGGAIPTLTADLASRANAAR